MDQVPPLDVAPLPNVDLRHLFVLTDDTAILQHADHATPNLTHGYCTDDTARALMTAVQVTALPDTCWAGENYGREDVIVLTQRYLAFLGYAYDESNGRFRNFMQYDRSWLEEVGSEDSHARTIWGLAQAVRLAPNNDIGDLAERLLLKALPVVETFQYLRPWAYALMGAADYLEVRPDQPLARELLHTMSDRLFRIWTHHADDEWPWWEDELTWGNAQIPHAMLLAGHVLKHREMIDASLDALRWLLEVQTAEEGHLSIIGNRGWYHRDQGRAQFDQQPIEAKGLVQTCLDAARITRDAFWCRQAEKCFAWFTGRNDIGRSLFNRETGGCSDGLSATGINANQGAESTLAYLLSVLALHLYHRE